MVVLGLILVLVAVVAGVVVVYENSGSDHVVTISAFGGQWRADAYWLAVIGAAVLVVAVLGIALIRGGGRRGMRRRQERKELERENAALAARVRTTDPGRSDAPTAYDPAQQSADPAGRDHRDPTRGSYRDPTDRSSYDEPPPPVAR